jgi:hypothetical protein
MSFDEYDVRNYTGAADRREEVYLPPGRPVRAADEGHAKFLGAVSWISQVRSLRK